jgi:hypothetical protein
MFIRQDGLIRSTWRRLRSPSARWSVLALVLIGIVIGFVATAVPQGRRAHRAAGMKGTCAV